MIDIKMTLLVCLLLPRIYMLDWSLTPTELQENYISSSTELVISVTEEIVLIGDLVSE